MIDFDFILSVVIPLISFVMGGLTTALFWVKGYADRRVDAEVKRYAAERDFGHLKRNYETLSAALSDLIERQEQGFERLADLIRGKQ